MRYKLTFVAYLILLVVSIVSKNKVINGFTSTYATVMIVYLLFEVLKKKKRSE